METPICSANVNLNVSAVACFEVAIDVTMSHHAVDTNKAYLIRQVVELEL